ncbi:thiol peroxidase [Loigolactobacillus coryniformis]|uniref:Peroxiredoxin n=1 Tax=Loigolactobacillus coryniformis subsp. coryniformis CECT 5711 TaxID=1185325 RepID=J3JCD1_9LACO|nr:thiol peroxidase [Loigolactobacillus coryniformis]EJN56499.1 Peroxiredoxin [Loigolactobacillus coryniformis subsp. coryniformis CECT 5711]MDC4185315.1 thiol peroxidase [Loigolactobacillus coryniformis]MDN5951004.1 thiol peroxidase [Loigolactobacillus coryniformis]MDN5952655.1 thiol peroxidase [Loigolactobacillus coryniformis]
MNVTMHGDPLTTVGEAPEVGTQLPDFKLSNKDGKTLTTDDFQDQTTLISVIPNINTSVCSVQTKHFNADADKVPNIRFVTVSTNTTAEQADWCAAEGVNKMEMLSDNAEEFGRAMGVFVPEAGINTRSIFIVDATGKIVYRELINEQTNEPDYSAALDFLATL